MTGARLLTEAYWPTATASTLLVPLGSLEQHGPHLPLDTDTRIAAAVAERAAAAAGPEVAVGPALPYGASGEHEGFPGTISIGSAALATVLVELLRSASRTFDRLVLVSGHGGNLDGVGAAVRQMRAESREVVAWFPALPGTDAHAGRTETSLLLAIAPQVVRAGPWATGAIEPVTVLMPRLRSAGVRAVSPSGVLGNPSGATAAEGERLLDRLVEQLVPLARAQRRSVQPA